MARVFKTDYTGRTVDISIFQFEGERLSGDIELSYGDPQQIITGIEVLKQIFTILFLNEIGTVLLEPRIGTVFGSAIGQSNIDVDTLQHVANIAVTDTVNTIVEDQLDSTQDIPDDEFLVDAVVRDIQVASGDSSQVRMQISISVRSGTTFDVFLPLSIGLVL